MCEMGDTGLEQTALTPPKTTISKERSAKKRALADGIDPDLVEVVKAWPDLPEDNRTAIKALIENHKAEKK